MAQASARRWSTQAERADARDRARRRAPTCAASSTRTCSTRARAQLLSSFDASGAASARRPSSRTAATLRLLLREQRARATRRRCTWRPSRSSAWRAAASTTSSAAAFTATAPTRSGSSRTSRRCCTTTRCSIAGVPRGATSSRGDHEFARVARESCEWALREMQTPEGGFASAQDADSEGEEGRFFVWTPDELDEVLGAAARALGGGVLRRDRRRATSSTARACCGGRVPARRGRARARHRARPSSRSAMQRSARAAARRARERACDPLTDDKVLASLERPDDQRARARASGARASRATSQAAQDARALRADRHAPAGRRGCSRPRARAARTSTRCLDDYVFMIQGLIDLYESDFDAALAARGARARARSSRRASPTPSSGGYFTTGDDHETA